MLSSIYTADLVFKGVVGGLILALVAMGIVLIYRSTRIINFAVGNLGLPATALLAIMAGKHGWPYWPSFVAALMVGILSATVIEVGIIRRLARAPRVILLVATIGVAQLCEVVTLQLPDYKTGRLQTQFPLPFQGEWEPGLDIRVSSAQIFVLTVVPLITLGLWWLLGHTAFGEAVRAAATNADLARMTGVSPKLLSTAVWAIGGFLSAMAIILVASDQGTTELVRIGPETLLRGMAAALVGGMVSFPRAALAAVAIGIAERLFVFNFPRETGLFQFVLFVLIAVLVARVSRESDAGGESFQFAPRVPPIPERLRDVWWVRHMGKLLGLAALSIAIAAPILTDLSVRHQTWAKVVAFAICAVSVVVLTGWAGQLSLGQMAFAGIGGLAAVALERGMSVDIGWRSTRILDGTLPALSFPWTILLGAAFACLVAVFVGLSALRVRGLLVAISTLAFAIAAQTYLLRRPFFVAGRTSVHTERKDIWFIDLDHKNRGYYYFTLFVLVVVVLVAIRLYRSGIGRAIVGVRENADGSAALTVSAVRAKLTAFAIAGFIAGLGGAVLTYAFPTFGPSERFFLVEDSLTVVSIAVIGGLGSPIGAVVGALWVVGLPEFFKGNETVPLFTSSIGLLLVLLYIPGGLLQIGYWMRGVLLDAVARRLPPAPTKTTTAPPTSLSRADVAAFAPVNADGSVLSTEGLTVRFGGLVAVNDVDFSARPGEVVGLIGNNGAGKSTLLNAIGGYVGASGSVHLLGHDIARKKTHQRASLGLGRTFQAAALFPDLTVRQTVMLAMEARRRSSFWGTLVFAPRSISRESANRAEAAELIDFLGLTRFADRHIAELSTGTRRIVELATVLAVAPKVICLDEPTAGVAQREAEAFGPLIKSIQRELDATLVIVEHDLPMILSISDRVYCLEAGAVIAEGSPEDVRANPLVIASYLGTDERAIARSDANIAAT